MNNCVHFPPLPPVRTNPDSLKGIIMTLFTFFVVLICVITFAYTMWANARNAKDSLSWATACLRKDFALVTEQQAERIAKLEASTQEIKRAYIALAESHVVLTSDLNEWRESQEKLNKKLCDAPNTFSKKAKKVTADLVLLEGCMTEYQKDLNDNTKALGTLVTILDFAFKSGQLFVPSEHRSTITGECSFEGAADCESFDGTTGGDHTDSLNIPIPPTGDEGGPATF